MANKRIPALVDVPAEHLWVSLEPLLEPVSLESIVMHAYAPASLNALSGELWPAVGDAEVEATNVEHLPHIEWGVVGGESGPGAREMDPDWARALRDEFKNSEIPFYFKQMAHKGPIPDDLMVRELAPRTEPKGTNHDAGEKRGDDRPLA
jgi:protein gp37